VVSGANGVQLAGPTRLLASAPTVLATVRCPVACRGTVAATIKIAGRRAALRLPGVAFARGVPGAHPVRVRLHAEARRLIAAAVKNGKAVSVHWTLKVAPKATKRPATRRR